MEHAHLIDVISSIMLFFGIAGIIVPLMQRLRISSVLAYLLCGIAVGPFGLAVFSVDLPWLSYVTIQDTGTVKVLGELGIIALLFMIGLELSISRLRELGRYIFGLGGLQIVITALIIFGIASVFDNTLQASVLIGASFALSSTAIVMKLLEEQRLSSRAIGVLCFSVLLMQDLAVIPILVLASSFTGASDVSIVLAIGKSLLLGALAVVAIYWLGKRVLTPLLQSVSFSKSPEWLAAFIVFVVIACAMLTDMAGLSLALGAFMAGLLIAETEFRHEVEVIINPLKGLLLGIFFLSVGMIVDIAEILRQPVLLLLSVLGIYLVKAGVIFPLCLGFRVPGRQAAEVSVYLSQPGEFALLILGVAASTQLMPTEDVQFFLLITVLAMMMTPFMFRLAPLAGRYGHRFFEGEKDTQTVSSLKHETGVLIAGFGRVGQLLGEKLGSQKIPYIAFDNDGAHIQKLKKQGFPVIYGDARKKELWAHLVHDGVVAVVIAIDDHRATENILKSLRAQFPLLPVIVRSRNVEDASALYDKGATVVIAETVESSLRLSNVLMEYLQKEESSEP